MIKITPINTTEAAKKFAELLTEKKTFFLNGAWGSGKSKFIEEVEKIMKKQACSKKFVTLNLWEIKDERSVVTIAFGKLHSRLTFLFNAIIPLCIAISILMTDVVNLGISSFLISLGFTEPHLKVILMFGGIIALIIAILKVFEVKTDRLYVHLLRLWQLENKVLIIDDFDRISITKQEEAYKLFNILRGKLPIVFLGDYSKIAENKGNFLQKIIDRQIELPYDLHPASIWKRYFDDLEKNLDFQIDNELKSLFVREKRNIREQEQFNDYVNLEFFTNRKIGHVQINQQLIIIYLYLFHKEYYQKMVSGWFPQPKSNNELGDVDSIMGIDNREFDNDIERVIYDVLGKNVLYPQCFIENKVGYFIFENVPNLSVKEAEDMLNDEENLKKIVLNNGKAQDDFYKYIVSQYKEYGSLNLDMLLSSEEGERVIQMNNDLMKKLETASFSLIKENQCSQLIHYVISERLNKFIISLEQSSVYNRTEMDREKETIDFFVTNYLDDFDLSQKIYFFDHFDIVNFNKLQENFSTEVARLLENKDIKEFSLQKQKVSILLLRVLESQKHWIGIENWSKELKNKILNLDDDDYIEFWRSFRILRINGNIPSQHEDYSEPVKLTIITGIHLSSAPKEEDRDFTAIVDFMKDRVLEISKKRKWSVNFKDENGRTN